MNAPAECTHAHTHTQRVLWPKPPAARTRTRAKRVGGWSCLCWSFPLVQCKVLGIYCPAMCTSATVEMPSYTSDFAAAICFVYRFAGRHAGVVNRRRPNVCACASRRRRRRHTWWWGAAASVLGACVPTVFLSVCRRVVWCARHRSRRRIRWQKHFAYDAFSRCPRAHPHPVVVFRAHTQRPPQ